MRSHTLNINRNSSEQRNVIQMCQLFLKVAKGLIFIEGSILIRLDFIIEIRTFWNSNYFECFSRITNSNRAICKFKHENLKFQIG